MDNQTDVFQQIKEQIERQRRIKERLIRVGKAPINDQTFKYDDSQIKRLSRVKQQLNTLSSLITRYYRNEIVV